MTHVRCKSGYSFSNAAFAGALPTLAAAGMATVWFAATAQAGGVPKGVWVDHTGRGAVEFSKCGRGICGTIVWTRKKADRHGCGQKLIGDVKPMGHNVWDGGWIISPESGTKYDVELKVLSRTKLQVTGYAGSKFLSKTMTWTRAPGTIQRCDSKDDDTQIAARSGDQNKSAAPNKKTAQFQVAALTNAPLPDRRPEVAAAEARARIAAAHPIAVPAPQPASPVGPRRTAEDDEIAEIIRAAEADESIVPPKPRVAKRDDDWTKYHRQMTANADDTCTVRAPFVTVSFPCRKRK